MAGVDKISGEMMPGRRAFAQSEEEYLWRQLVEHRGDLWEQLWHGVREREFVGCYPTRHVFKRELIS